MAVYCTPRVKYTVDALRPLVYRLVVRLVVAPPKDDAIGMAAFWAVVIAERRGRDERKGKEDGRLGVGWA